MLYQWVEQVHKTGACGKFMRQRGSAVACRTGADDFPCTPGRNYSDRAVESFAEWCTNKRLEGEEQRLQRWH